MDSEGTRTGGYEGEPAQIAPEITLLAAAVARTGAIPLMPTADNVVVLPEGASLDDVTVQGRDLVITLDDGRTFVIPDGAVYVPEIVVAGVAVPPLNLAALLIGNEPQPAAGAVQSSGGNFADPVGPIQAAYDLGNLLPYTEFGFVPQPEEEVIPGLANNKPDVVIQDGGPASDDVTDQVSEAGLPNPRTGGALESPGTLAGNGSNSTDGTIIITSPDGIDSVTINGQLVTGLAGQSIVTDKGVLVLGALSGNEIPYVYTLADNTSGDSTTDVFNVQVTDPDGDVADARLTIVIADDVPQAVNDSAAQTAEDAPVTVAVLTNDVPGADGVAPGTVAVVAGTLTGTGSLAVNPDGTITYTPGPGEEGPVTFDYTIQDGDGDPSRATVTITLLADSVPSVSVSGENTVSEAGLPARPDEPAGSDSGSNSEGTSGTLAISTGNDTLASLVINGVDVTAGGTVTTDRGVLTVTLSGGAYSYSYTLTDNTLADPSDTFTVTVTDSDGDHASTPLVITIADDVPLAVNDSATQAAENAPVTVAVLTNDVPGADGVAPGTVAVVPGTLTGTGSLEVHADGTITYTPGAGEEGTVTFDYSIQDGDGDPSSATVTITLLEDSVPQVSIRGENAVYEEGLPARPGEPAGSDSGSNSETTSGTIAIGTGNDTLASLVINGIDVTAGGTVTTAKGELTVTLTAGVYSYSYTLTDNTLSDPDSDTFSVTVTDSDGDPATTSLVVAIMDDVPTAADDGTFTVAEQTPLTFNALTNDTFGADGVNIATSVAITTDPAKGTVTYNGATGEFTYTPAAGAEGSDSFTYTITDGDGDPSTATVTFNIAADSVPNILSTANLAVDEDGLAGANSDTAPLQASPAEAAGTGLATDSGSTTVNFGADTPANLAASIVLVDTAGLDTQLKTLDGNFVTFALESGVLVGRSSGGAEVISISVTSANPGPNPGDVVYTYAVTLSQPVQHPTAGTEDVLTLSGVTFQVTDSDGSPATGNFAITVLDDVPSIDLVMGADSGVVLGTLDANTDGTPTSEDTASSTASFGGVFSINAAGTSAGADGAASQTLTYALNIADAVSGLTSHGAAITLYQLADGTVVGATSASAPVNVLSPSVVFSVAVASDGSVTLTQYQQIDHGAPGVPVGPYDTQFTTLADGKLSLTATATLTDRDGDVATEHETVDLGGNIRFADDGPAFSNVGAGGSVTLDETAAGSPAGYGVSGISVTSATAMISATAAFGADGPAASGSLVYGLTITGGGATPLKTAIGDYPISLAQVGTDTVEGRYVDGALVTQVAFRLVIGSDGKVTVTEFVPLEHNLDGNTAPAYDDPLTLTDAQGASLISATVTAKDFDGDTANATAAIGANITFRDDGPAAHDDTDSVAAGSVGPADGNLITAAGGSDGNPTDGVADYVGADGAFVSSVTGAGAATSVPGTGTTLVAGLYGTLTIAADGSYSYARTAGEGGGLSDSFTYTLTDNDGDYSVATLTIAIANLVPVAGAASATVDDEGLGGILGGTGDINANTGDLDLTSEAIFKGMLGGTAGDGTSTFLFQASLAGTTQVMGQETVTYSVSADGSLLTATITASPDGSRINTPLFTVQITNQTTGAYTLTLADNVLHAAGGNENNVNIAIPYQLKDQGGELSAAPGSLSVQFNDDTPTLGTVQNQQASNDPVQTPAIGTLHFAAGADGAGSAMTITANLTGIKSGGHSLLASQSGNVLTAYADVDSSGTINAGDTVAFTLTVNPAAGTSGQYVFNLVAPLDGVISDVEIGSGSSFGVGPSSSVIVTDNATNVQLVQVTGWAPTASFSEATWLTGTVPSLTQTSNVNGSTQGWGLANNNFDSGEFMRFDFGVVSDFDGPGGYTPPASGPFANVSYATFEFFNFTAGEKVEFVAHYTNGTTQAIVLTSSPAGDALTITAPAGAQIAWVDVYESSGSIKLNLTHVGVQSTTVDNTIPFTVQLTDGDGDPTVTSAFTVHVADGLAPLSPAAPVVVDLNSDGVHFLSTFAGVTYDYAGDGTKVATAWAAPDDGILAIDLDHDGHVSSAQEFVFGGNGLTDLQGLAAQYDSNHDGVLDAQDAQFASFGVWQDANSNGVSDAGEFDTLTELGITSIKLTSDGVSYAAADGDVVVAGTTTVQYADGTTTTAADASFAISQLSRQLESTVTVAAASSLVTVAATVTVAEIVTSETAPTEDTTSTETTTLTATTSESDATQPSADLSLIASDEPAKTLEPAHDVQTMSEPSAPAHLAALADNAADFGNGASGDHDAHDAGLVQAAAITFDAPAAVQAMDALLVAAAGGQQGGTQAPAVTATDLPGVQEALAEGHAANFVDALIDSVIGQAADTASAGAGHSPMLAELLAAHVDTGTTMTMAPANFDFGHAGLEAALATAHA